LALASRSCVAEPGGTLKIALPPRPALHIYPPRVPPVMFARGNRGDAMTAIDYILIFIVIVLIILWLLARAR
jgi:hypothetical protein